MFPNFLVTGLRIVWINVIDGLVTQDKENVWLTTVKYFKNLGSRVRQNHPVNFNRPNTTNIGFDNL